MCSSGENWISEFLRLVRTDVSFPSVADQMYQDSIPYQALLRTLTPEQRAPILQYVKSLQEVEACMTRIAYYQGYQKAMKECRQNQDETL